MSIALGGCLRPPPIALGLTEDTGGHLTYLWGAAAALSRRRDVTHVEIVTRLIDDSTLGSDYAQPHQIIDDALSIRRVATGNRAYLSKAAAAGDRPSFIAALIADLERRVVLPDVIHAHFADAADVAIALRERCGIRFIYTAHSLATDKAACGLSFPDLAERLASEDRAIGAADAIIASSRDEAERQLMRYPAADAARIFCVPPGAVLDDREIVDATRGRALLAPFLRHPERPMLLAIARPVHKKNLGSLVDLYATCPGLRDKANLVIVAGLRDAPDSGEPEQQAVIAGLLERLDRHDLYGSLALPKRHDQADVASLYVLARESGGLFVNPALTEPYGLTLTEAAHHGLPVVATTSGGAADIVAMLEHGKSADPADPAAFGAAISSLLVDRFAWRRASRNGRERATNLNWDAYAAHFVTIASAVVAQPTTAALPTPTPTPMPRGRALLLCDIDNTLTGCRTGAAELVAHLRTDRALLFGVATGRSLQEARRILGDWGYPEPCAWVTSVGTEIAWTRGTLAYGDRDFADYLAEGWHADAIMAALADFSGITLQPAVEQRRFKRSWFATDQATAIRVRARLMDQGLPAKVVFSHGRFLDILPENGGKGAAMHWVARKLDLPLTAIHAAGDSGNDFDMLDACPNAILVANHSSELGHLVGKPGVRVAHRPHAGGIVDILRAIDTDSSSPLDCRFAA